LTAVVTPVWHEYLAKARDLYRTCQAELAPFVTHHLPIAAAGEAFSLYERHADGVVKILLDAQAW
jgi:threonine dehydrogenase-like Zn-dependent dehydrogenase